MYPNFGTLGAFIKWDISEEYKFTDRVLNISSQKTLGLIDKTIALDAKISK